MIVTISIVLNDNYLKLVMRSGGHHVVLDRLE